MEFVVYIVFSHKFQKHYTGFTSNLIARFYSHNKMATKGWTIKFRPWKVIHVEFFNSKNEALAREKFLKTGVGRQHIHENILSKYK
jgi:putative endonuclease